MAQRVTIDAEINAIRANTQLSDLERRIAILAQRSTGIRLSFDNDGQLTRQVETVVDRFGRIQTITTRWHDEIREVTNDTGELERVTERVQEQTTTINNNLEKRAKLAEKLRKEEQQLLELEQQRSRIAAQARQAELQQSIDAKRQAMSYSSDPDAVMSATRSYYHAQQQAEYDRMGEELYQQALQRAREFESDQYNRQLQEATIASNRFRAENEKVVEGIKALDEAFNQVASIGLRKLKQAFNEALSEMKSVDSALVVVRKVTDFTEEQLESLRTHAYEIGKEYGVTASKYLDAVAEMSRAGYKEQSADLAELAVKLQIVGDVSEETANKFLIATDKAYGFNGDVEKLSATIDQLNEIDNNFATSIQKMADGMGIIAPIASQAHVSLDKLEAALGTITATTQRSGSETARALRALFLNIMGDTQTEIEEGATWTAGEIAGLRDVLREYAKSAVEAAEATGEVIDPMKAIEALAQSYKDGVLTEAKLMEMVSDIGGKLRSSQLLALIQNWDMYNDMLEKTKNAVGSADREVERALNSWEKKINILKNTWTDFVQKTLNSDLIKNVLDFGTKALESFGDLGTVIEILALTQLPKAIGGFQAITTSITNVSTWALHLGGDFKGLIASISNFKSLSSAAAKGSDQLATALQNVNVGASAAAAGIGAAVALISVAIISWKAYINSLNEKISNAQSAKDGLDSINELKEKYDNLKESLESGEDVASEFAASRDALIEKLKDEGVWVESVTGKYETLGEKIDAASKKASNYYQVELNDARKASEDKIKILTDWEKAGSTYDIVDYYIYGRYRRADNGALWNKEEISIENLIDLYDKAKDRRAELFEGGHSGNKEDKALERFINLYGDAIEEYRKVNDIINDLNDSTDGLSNSTGDLASSVQVGTLAFIGLSDEISNATKSLEAYKKALESGEKGDTLKSYAEAYTSALSMFEQGLTGTNQYVSAIDLLIPKDVLSALHYDYEEAGKLLGTDFYKALFEYDGEDFGANAAQYLKDNEKIYSAFYDVIDDGDSGFKIAVTDIKGLSEELKISEDALWSMLDGWDAFNSATSVSISDLTLLKDQFTNVETGAFDFTSLIAELVNKGKTNTEIRNIVQGLAQMEDIDLSELPDNLTKAIEDARSLKEKADALGKGFEIKVETDPVDATSVLDPLTKKIDLLNNTTVTIKAVYTGEPIAPDSFIGPRLQHHERGVKKADAGLAIVNEKGAELIKSGNRAYIANNGQLGLVSLKEGDTVYNASETRSMLNKMVSTDDSLNGSKKTTDGTTSSFVNSTFEAFLEKLKAAKGDEKDNNKSPSGGGGSKGSTTKDSDLLSMLSDYIKELLDKAKKALDAQIDAIDAQIDALKKQHDAEEEANELEELRLKILEAEKNLVDANVERTVRYFNKATGQWEWMADQKAVAEAQKALEDAQQAYYDKLAEMEYQAKLDELQAQKDALKENYNALSDNWNDIKDEISKALNKKDVLSLAEILTKLGLTAASGSVGGVNSLIADINAFTGSFDNGGFAFGKGFLLKGISHGETVLDESITDRILSPKSNSQFTNFTNSLTKLFGMSSGDIGAKAQSLINSIDRSSNISGDTYYINGVRIGSDMMDRPLSEILSVLPIYAS